VIAGSDHPVESLAPLTGLERLCAGGNGAVTLPLDAALSIMTDASAGTTVLSEDPHDIAEDDLAQIEIEDVIVTST
jgi:predicted amidohydrolase YtcJ